MSMRIFQCALLSSVAASVFLGSPSLVYAAKREKAATVKGPTAHAILVNSKGEKVGTATLAQVKGVVKIDLEASGLSPGKHGIHIHESGVCEGPGFKSAGGHYSPAGKHHGLENPEGPHSGDLPNLVVKEDGTVKTRMSTSRVSLNAGSPGNAGSAGDQSLLKPGGTAIVIHAKGDDQKSDPAGDSGDRMVCGVIMAGAQ